MNEQTLVEECKQGNQKAMGDLYDHYAPKMKAICLRYVKHHEEAEDILQEAFIKIFKNINRYQDQKNLTGWIKTIVINTSINMYYKNKNMQMNVDYDAVIGSEKHAATIADQLTLNELYDVINSLPEGYKVVFNLYAIDGYDHKEIGEMLKISESTSRSQYARARKVLMEKLNQLEP